MRKLAGDSQNAVIHTSTSSAHALPSSVRLDRRQLLKSGAGLLAGATLGMPSAHANTFPSKPVRIVVPFAPGGATDVLARSVAEKMSTAMGQPTIVENRPGGAGLIGGDVVAKAAPDGHTLFLGTTSTMMSMQFLFKKMPFDPQKNLTPVSRVCLAPIVLVVTADLPVHNVKELIAYVKERPGQLSYGSYGIGSHGHLAIATVDALAGGKMNHIAYKGEAPMVQELLGNQLKIGMGSTLSLKQHIDSGRLRPIAFSGKNRVPALPDVTTFEEQGFKQDAFSIVGWLGIAATGGTPQPIIDQLGAFARQALQTREVNARVLQAGFVPYSDDTPQRYNKAWHDEMSIWEKLLKEAGVQPN